MQSDTGKNPDTQAQTAPVAQAAPAARAATRAAPKAAPTTAAAPAADPVVSSPASIAQAAKARLAGAKPAAPAAAAFVPRVQKGVIREPERIIIHGAPGIGKSSLAACAPDALFLDLEHGTKQLDVERVDNIATWEQLQGSLRWLATATTPYKTVVLDTLDKAEWLCQQHICAQANVKSIEKVGKFGAGFLAVYEQFRALLRLIEEVRRTGKRIILVSHSKLEHVPNVTGEDYQRWTLKVHRNVAGMFYEGFDAVLFARLETFTKEKGSGGFRAFGETRVIETQESPAWLAKNRYAMPKQMLMDWTEVGTALESGADKVAESIRMEAASAIDVLATLDGAKAASAIDVLAKTANNPQQLLAVLNRVNQRIAELSPESDPEAEQGDGNTTDGSGYDAQ